MVYSKLCTCISPWFSLDHESHMSIFFINNRVFSWILVWRHLRSKLSCICLLLSLRNQNYWSGSLEGLLLLLVCICDTFKNQFVLWFQFGPLSCLSELKLLWLNTVFWFRCLHRWLILFTTAAKNSLFSIILAIHVRISLHLYYNFCILTISTLDSLRANLCTHWSCTSR